MVRVAVPTGEADLAADALWRVGAIAIEERETPTGVVLVAGVAAGADIAPLLAAVDGIWPAEVVAVDIDSALDAWRAFARAVPVGQRLLVRPPWLPAGPHEAAVEVLIDPERAFGSGAHASTRRRSPAPPGPRGPADRAFRRHPAWEFVARSQLNSWASQQR